MSWRFSAFGGVPRRAYRMRVGLATMAFSMICVVSARASTFSGYITVNNSSQYVSKVLNSYGEYVITTNLADALTVSFNPGTAPFSIAATNNSGSYTYPYFGGILGFASNSANIAAGSYNYLYLGGTGLTAAGSVPSSGGNTFTAATGITESFESSIWSISSTFVLTPQWVNSDTSTPATVLVDNAGILLLTGDPAVFAGTFGHSDIDSLTFVCTAQGGCGVPGARAVVPEPASALFALPVVGLIIATVRRQRRCRFDAAA